jgi:hypothetical protein
MFLLHVYHTVNSIDERSKDFLVDYMMGLSSHSFVHCSKLIFEYYKEGRTE